MSLSRNPWLCAWNSSRENFLSPRPCVIPEWMNRTIVCRQPLVVADKLRAITVNRGINCRVPTPSGHTDILDKRCTMINGLCQVHIDQQVPWIKARIKERDTDDPIGGNSHLRLKLVRSITLGIIVHPNRCSPGQSVIL